jgi:hypothetical protein
MEIVVILIGYPYIRIRSMLISKKTYEAVISAHEMLTKDISWLEEQINPLIIRQAAMLLEQSKMEIEYLIPKISITEVFPKIGRPTTDLDKSVLKSSVEPHLRGHATYIYRKSKKRFNIYIGPISDFTNGKEDKLAMDIAKKKAYNYLKKSHPDVFENVTEMS